MPLSTAQRNYFGADVKFHDIGATFTHWIADHNTLWKYPVTDEAVSVAISYYTLLGSGPDSLWWIWMGVAALAMLGTGWRIARGFKNVAGRGSGGGYLFDGGSLVLLVTVFFTQLNDVRRAIAEVTAATHSHNGPELATSEAMSSLVQDLAGNNALISVALTGVMLLQAGRYYSERADRKAAQARAVEEADSAASSQANTPPRRSGTPYRELAEEQVMDFSDAVTDAVPSKGGKDGKSSHVAGATPIVRAR